MPLPAPVGTKHERATASLRVGRAALAAQQVLSDGLAGNAVADEDGVDDWGLWRLRLRNLRGL